MKPYISGRWWWTCPVLAIALAATTLVIYGITWWTAALTALLLVCPALMLWGVIEFRSRGRDSGEVRGE